MADRLHDGSGIELAAGRPLFPVAALRSMGWIAGEGTSWATPDDDDLDEEPMLVTLWKGATVDTPGKADRDLYLGETDFGGARCRSAGRGQRLDSSNRARSRTGGRPPARMIQK